MKYLILLALLSLAIPSNATEYAVVFIDGTIPEDSRAIVYANLSEIGGMAVNTNDMMVWRLKADHDITGVVVSTRSDQYGKNGWKNLPLAQAETRISKDVRPPDKQKLKVMSREDFFVLYEEVPLD